MTDKHQALRDFILAEMSARNMSGREFAKFVGVSSATISRAVGFDKTPEPTIGFLGQLANATHTDIRDLITLVAPDAYTTEPSTEARLLATAIQKLPDDLRDMIQTFIEKRSASTNQD